MLRTTMMVLATAAALSVGLTADAAALATAHSGWDGLGDGGHTVVGPVAVRTLGVGSAGAISAVLARLLAAALRVSAFRRAATALRRHRQSANENYCCGLVDGRQG